MSQNVAEWRYVERLEQATDNSNIQVLKGGKFVSDSSWCAPFACD